MDLRIDYINIPTYIATAILMKEYLNGNQDVKDGLVKGLKLSKKTGFRGHGENWKLALPSYANIEK